MASARPQHGKDMSDDDYIYDEATGEWRPASEVKQAAAAAAAPVVRLSLIHI